MPVYDEKYMKTKVREFDGVIKTNFLGDKIPKENEQYTCNLHCLYNYWFCYENGQEKLSACLFGRVKIQNKENKNN